MGCCTRAGRTVFSFLHGGPYSAVAWICDKQNTGVLTTALRARFSLLFIHQEPSLLSSQRNWIKFLLFKFMWVLCLVARAPCKAQFSLCVHLCASCAGRVGVLTGMLDTGWTWGHGATSASCLGGWGLRGSLEP